MNETLVEHAIKANDATGNYFDLNYKPLDAFLAKFAKLIVEESARLVEESKWNLPRGCTAADQAKYIKEHFGVK